MSTPADLYEVDPTVPTPAATATTSTAPERPPMTASPLLRPVFLPVAAEPTPIPGTSPRRDGIVRVVHRPADAAKAEATDARPETASTACGCGTVEEITDAVAASIRPALDRITEALETLLGEVAEMRSRLDADLADG